MLKVKICGVTNPADAAAAAEEGADYIGLIFAPGSPRRLEPAAARRIVRGLPPGVEPVGVFRDQPLGEVLGILRDAGLGLAQLHGDESPEYARRLGVPVFKSFENHDEGTLGRMKDYEVFAFLLDVPKGSGGRVDPGWALRAKERGRIFLAGNLDPEAVAELVARVRPFGVDGCSWMEKAPGVKDRAKVRAFIQAARAAFP